MQVVAILRNARCLWLLRFICHKTLILQIFLVIISGETLILARWNSLLLALIIIHPWIVHLNNRDI